MYNLRIACISHVSPEKDYVFDMTIENIENAHAVIEELNDAITNCHCELLSIYKEGKRS